MAKQQLRRTYQVKEPNIIKATENNSTKISDADNGKIFQKFDIKEIVFLAILSASLLVSCAVMPLVIPLLDVVFGIAQLVTGLQMSLFITLGLIKVRKPFTLSLILLFMSILMIFMAVQTFYGNLLTMVLVETLILVVFKGYKKDIACFVAGAIVPLVGLIVPIIWNAVVAPDVFAVLINNTWIVIGMISAVIAVGLIGAFIGLKIGKEMTKAGIVSK